MTADKKLTFAEVGEGIIEFESIFKASAEAGVEWFIIEQDTCQRLPLESVKISLENIKKIEENIGMI